MDQHDDEHAWRRRSQAMGAEAFSARISDAAGDFTPERQAEVARILALHGAVHVVNTGLSSADDVVAAMPGLGFGPDQQFHDGGRTSGAWQHKWVRPGLRRMDHYPASLYLLPNNEVQYQRTTPARVLFFFPRAPHEGGRTFLHSAAAVEAGLRAAGPVGVELLEKLERHGVVIETGFLDRRHPLKADNTFQSWQERFDTDDDGVALLRARAHEAGDGTDTGAWWLDEQAIDDDGRPLRTLMTRILLSAFMTHPGDGRRYLRFPRLAADGPSTRNGHRRFPLGNDVELTSSERRLLRQVYLDTREGLQLHDGDVILFDNLRFGHSREVFTGGREVLVGMAGSLRNDGPHGATTTTTTTTTTAATTSPIGRFAQPSSSATRYVLPGAALLATGTSARVFHAGGALDDLTLAAIASAFRQHGAVHVRHTGLDRRALRADGLPAPVLQALGFGADDAFPWGGMASGRTVRASLSKELRATDDYPPDLWLLPHNEILYQRQVPGRLLFVAVDVADATGGRTFVHDALATEGFIQRSGDVGVRLLSSLRSCGLLIEMGFIDEGHPARPRNFFRSWQDRFDTTSKDEALHRCRAATHQFDEAWWHDETLPDGRTVSTLMTRIRVPAFQVSDVDGRERLLFPRIALDGPAAHNGFRRYTLGDGTPLSDDEVDVLLSAFIATREGIPWQDGDLLVVDNIRFGHSREAFTGRRRIGVAMAGVVDVPAPRPRPQARP